MTQKHGKWGGGAPPPARYADKKKGKYTALLKKHALKRKVEFAVCMFEVSGGFSKSALTLLKKAADMADKNKVRLKTGEWSWSAMDFSSYFMQLLSFEINKLSAMAVLNGVRAAAAAATV